MSFPRIKNPLFAVSLAIVSLAAFAQEAAPVPSSQKPPEWTKSDTNRDGYLTKSEFLPFGSLGKHFDEMDLNHDNKISEEEYNDWFQHHKE